ncbi:hypothetical protein GYH30_048027 [Glycine max]|uniref:Phosphoribulokinase/uridine kinase domain-containing protein n=1 Tax=Glycine max TaxID=3847 RepID=A0A0R0FQY0_SOYBN|nr:hypothetical protein GYH30_048027 [Glycine max]
MSIFYADADVRLARRIRRDTSEKGRDIGAVLDQYSKFVKPAFDDFILPTKKYADIIIPRGGDNHVAIGLTVQHIRTKLGKHDLCNIYPNLYVIQPTFQEGVRAGVSLSKVSALSEYHPLSEASARLASQRYLEGNLARIHPPSAPSARTASRLSLLTLSAPGSLSQTTLRGQKTLLKDEVRKKGERLNPLLGNSAEI